VEKKEKKRKKWTKKTLPPWAVPLVIDLPMSDERRLRKICHVAPPPCPATETWETWETWDGRDGKKRRGGERRGNPENLGIGSYYGNMVKTPGQIIRNNKIEVPLFGPLGGEYLTLLMLTLLFLERAHTIY
jgi:hypothetical protein